MKPTVYFIDSDRDNLEMMKYVLENEGFNVTTSLSFEESRLAVLEDNFGAVILDNHIKSLESVEICRKIRSVNKTMPIIFYSAEPEQTGIQKLKDAEANAYVLKPYFGKLIEKVVELIQLNQVN